MAAPAAPLTDEWAKKRRDARIHALLVKFRGDVDRVAQVGWYCTTWTREDVLRVRRDYPPGEPPAIVPGPGKPGRPRLHPDDDTPVPTPREPGPGWPTLRSLERPAPVEVVDVAEPDDVPDVLPPLPEVLLTPVQMLVLREACKGLTNAQIGKSLLIAEDTVKSHMRALFRALEVGDRTSLVIRVLACEVRPVEKSAPGPAPRACEPAPPPKRASARAMPRTAAGADATGEPVRRRGRAPQEIAHGSPGGYGTHLRRKEPFPEDTGQEPCGCRKAHSVEVRASQLRRAAQ